MEVDLFPMRKDNVDLLAREYIAASSFAAVPEYLMHLTETCEVLGQFVWLHVRVREEEKFLPAFMREYDLGEFLGPHQSWSDRYSIRSARHTFRLLFLGTPFDQPFNVCSDALDWFAKSNNLDAFAGALSRVLPSHGCSGVLALGVRANIVFPSQVSWKVSDYLPDAEVAVKSMKIDEFIGTLGSDSRSNFRRRLHKIRDAGIEVTKMPPADSQLAFAWDCYQKTFARAKLKWLGIPRMYWTPSIWFEKHCDLFVAHCESEFLGFTLMVRSGSLYVNHRMGLAYKADQSANEYFALLFATFASAAASGMQVSLGPTTYDTKLRLGARIVHRSMLSLFWDRTVHEDIGSALNQSMRELLDDLRRY